ncbi:hypothetical protein CXB51_036401 [Gossypium anomalum]|uniref:Conserved oligomeric Golgi complex subunit 3 n=1 Tax=Gossypium anomalum TaxID=47600 RepID=A0A8J6CGL7_9ROSI|nr:hypothetical protein CXB51_036401 [Gossypium anomalum]
MATNPATAPSKLPKSGAISKGYNFASTWEQNAPLTEQQQLAIQMLSHAVAERPFPANLAQERTSGQDKVLSISTTDDNFRDSEAIDEILVNSNQFYKWFTDLESALRSETEEKYQHYVDTLIDRIQTCDDILRQVDETLDLFNELQLQHQAVETKTKTLHDACNRLVMEKQRLIEFAEALRSKLKYFDELENVSSSGIYGLSNFTSSIQITSNFYSPNMNVGNANFLPLLKRLDECILYVENNPQYAESSVYLLKFRQLQSRALGMIRSHVVSVLKSASSQVQAAIWSSGGSKESFSEGVEASIIYVRFKAAASELKPILEEIESKASRKEYVHLLAECHKLYCEQRLSLIKGTVHQRISEFAKKEGLPSLTRSGCAYLMQVCQLEHQLFHHFFPSSSEDVSSLAPLIDPLSTYLYDTLRPKLIHEANVDFLCEMVDILKVEVLGEQLSRKINTTHPNIEHIVFLNTQIANYIPINEDLDYPAKLEHSADVVSETATNANPDVFKTWYTPLEKTISFISKLYRSLEPAVFTGLAQEAVEVCSVSIQKASKLIAKRSTPMDGQLFLIKHLLILREQIAPFDIEFSVTHKELDFSHLLENLRRILRGQTSLFDWSGSTSLARTLSPRVLESQVDAKKELEKILKATCEEFIMAVTKQVVDPMLSFVTKVTAVKVALSSGTQNQKRDSVMAKPLKEQAFATPEAVAELVQKVHSAIQRELPVVIAKMKLYLQNPSTRTILFKPIKTNIVEAHIQIQSLLKAEYSPEEKRTINMVPIEELESQLDNLL